jgi:hypothetical protein
MFFCGLAIIHHNQIEVCVVYSKLSCVLQLEEYAVAKFIVPDWGDKVDSGIGLSYRPARLHRLAARYDTIPHAGVNHFLQSGTMNLAIGVFLEEHCDSTEDKNKYNSESSVILF